MRVALAVVAFGLIGVTVHGQDRMITVSVIGADQSGQVAPAIIDVGVDGLAVGGTAVTTPLPPHFFYSHQLVAMAGARYVSWLATVVTGLSYYDCAEYVAVFDVRSQVARVVPDLAIPCQIARLIPDSRRPRVFLHAWATASGSPGLVAAIDQDLGLKPIVVGQWVGTTVAYAPDVDWLFVTRLGTREDPSMKIAVFSGSTGAEITSFAVPGAGNPAGAHMEVTKDGSRVFLYAGEFSGQHAPIRSFDVSTGQEVARSTAFFLGNGSYDRFALDWERQLVLVPHYEESLNRRRLVALNAMSLQILGELNPGGYAYSNTFQPVRGRGEALAYLVHPRLDAVTTTCRLWLDAFDSGGAVRVHKDIGEIAGWFPRPSSAACQAAVVLLSKPGPATGLTASVEGRRVTLAWNNPEDVADVELEVGFAPGARDLSNRVGVIQRLTANKVPSGTYYIRVIGINEVGRSDPSSEICVVVP